MATKLLKKQFNLPLNKTISNNSKCFIVAEISANHSGDLKLLKKTMLEAKKIGADAVKIQTYQADTMTLNVNNNHFKIDDNSIWKGKKLYSLYQKAETPFKWHKEIFKFAKRNKILCFSAPFDITAVKLLKKNNCPLYKVASPEIEDLELIKEIAKTKKPIIISTGIASENNIKNALKICKKEKNYKIILLNCISSYPAQDIELNLLHINILKKYVPVVGYSDHSNSDLPCLISVALGAKVIEKHFMLNNKIKSPDKLFSYDSKKLKKLIVSIRAVEKMLGHEKIDKKKILKGKLKTVTRSLFFSKDIQKGMRINHENIKSVRPGTGLNLSFFKKILNKKLNRNVLKGDPVKLKDIVF